MRTDFQVFRCFFGVLLSGALLSGVVASTSDGNDGIDFNRDVRPIVSGVCVACHGPDESAREAGLRLDTFEGATADLGGYAAIVPGDSSASEMISRITSEDLEMRMPPPGKGRALTEAEIALLRRWIESGAQYDKHWAYQAPARRTLPAVEQADWPRHPVDHFILEKLEANGLSPSTRADRRTLARRVALALTGLPPSLDELKHFEADASPDAYERFVDAQLRKPAFGERWARVWLDLARYADSAGYADDPPRTIWAYRDYVIKSLNENKPFDQFTIEQLAGDLLASPTDEQLTATAFHRNTMTNNEGGTNDEQFRNEAVVDRVNTTFAVWMGTTMACAQCHTHKYDPITQEEYFQVFHIFNQTEDADRRDESPLLEIWSEQQAQQKSELNQQIAALRKILDQQTPELESAFNEWLASLNRPPTWDLSVPTLAESPNAALTISDSGTVRLEGQRPDQAVYRLEIPVNASQQVAALQLKVSDKQTSNFVLSHISAEYRPNESQPLQARYVKLSLPGSQRFLHVAEIEVYEAGKNIAIGAQATQSSTSFGGEASRAVDGNTDGDYYKHSVTHTAEEDSPWLLIDFGRDVNVDRVVLWNRTDGGQAIQGRIKDCTIELMDAEQKSVEKISPADVPAPSYEANFTGVRKLNFAAAIADYSQPNFPASDALSSRANNAELADDKGWAIGGATGRPHELTLVLHHPLKLEAGLIRVELQQVSKFGQHVLTEFQLATTDDGNVQQWAAMPTSIRELALKQSLDVSEQSQLKAYYRTLSPILEETRNQLAAAEKRLSELKPETSVPIFKELPLSKSRETFVQLRGNYLSLGDKVTAGVPQAFHGYQTADEAATQLAADRKDPTVEQMNRLDFANWLVDANNPLTARVVVNRHWEQIFGIGIVETSEEFGSQGELPTHPELLDWLSIDLVENGWDIKRLLKQLVMSATYQQASQVNEQLLAIDPDNRLYARGPRFRISAEMVRDQSLAVAGLLSNKMYGPPVRPPQPNLGLSAAFGSGTDWQTSDGEDKYRRGVYTTWRRSNPYPSMATFDAPNREVCTLRRSRTNTPLQALVTLNDPVYVEAAQSLARQMHKQATLAEKLSYGLELCLLRPADERELVRLESLYHELLAEFSETPAEAKKIAEQPLGPLPAGWNPVELAALTVVANVLLNLDEFLMPR